MSSTVLAQEMPVSHGDSPDLAPATLLEEKDSHMMNLFHALQRFLESSSSGHRVTDLLGTVDLAIERSDVDENQKSAWRVRRQELTPSLWQKQAEFLIREGKDLVNSLPFHLWDIRRKLYELDGKLVEKPSVGYADGPKASALLNEFDFLIHEGNRERVNCLAHYPELAVVRRQIEQRRDYMRSHHKTMDLQERGQPPSGGHPRPRFSF